MASTKRDLPFGDEHLSKRSRVSESEPSQFPAAGVPVVLNPADCDIDFNVEGGGLQGSALYEQGFAYCWSGARANIGISKGKYYFGCKIISAQPVDMEDTPQHNQHVCRVGISRGDDAVRNLGETAHSFGFGGTGKFSNSRNFVSYGEEFGVGDTVVCYVDLESWPMASIAFSKNGKWLGIAKHFDAGPSGLGLLGSPMKKLQWEFALFPHVLLKNVVVQMQFTIDDGLIPKEGYKPWGAAISNGNAVLGPSFSNPDGCEVIMMVGLPASGKTTWAEKFVMEHREKRYVLLGTNLALEQMKVPGLLRKHNYGERFDRLMDRATKIFNILLSRASKIHRNFIIDQTNVYKSARKRKLKPFANYIKIAVVVFPRAEDLKFRADKRFKEMGKEVPAEAVNQMLANYSLPMSKDMHMTDEYFDQVLFVELGRAESERLLEEMQHMKPSMPPSSHENSRITTSSSLSCNIVPLQNQGIVDDKQSSFSSRSSLHDPHGKSYHSSTYDSRTDFNIMGSLSFGGYEGSKINELWGTGQPNHGSIEQVYRSSRLGDSYNHSSIEGSHFSRGVTVDTRNNSSVYNANNDRFVNGSGAGPYNLPAMRRSTYQPAPPFPHGSFNTHISRPPYGSISSDVQHANPWRPPMNLPTNVQPPYGRFPMDPPPFLPNPYPSQNYHMDAPHPPPFPPGY